MSTDTDLLDAVREGNKWLRLIALPSLRAMLANELDTDQKRRVYQESDGRQIRDVAKSAGAGFGSVHRYWQDWAAKSLLERTELAGRYRRLIDLAEVGMEVD